MKALLTIGLLILSNAFMTLAWYGHLKFAEWKSSMTQASHTGTIIAHARFLPMAPIAIGGMAF